jgi:endoglucanase
MDGEGLKFTDSHFLDIDNFEINIGINVASWLSVPKYTGAQRLSFFQEKDVELLSSLGFDHIRLCVDEVELWGEDGTKHSEGFNLLHNAIRWCEKHGLRIIVDMHIARNHRFTASENTLFTDPAEADKFVKLWEDLSDELYKYPNLLAAYELLNEPISADPKNWNRVSALAINALRAKEPDRTIIVGVCTSNSGARYNEFRG